MFLNGGNPSEAPIDTTPLVQKAKEGSVASSVLLTGNVTASIDQYIFQVTLGAVIVDVLLIAGCDISCQ